MWISVSALNEAIGDGQLALAAFSLAMIITIEVFWPLKQPFVFDPEALSKRLNLSASPRFLSATEGDPVSGSLRATRFAYTVQLSPQQRLYFWPEPQDRGYCGRPWRGRDGGCAAAPLGANLGDQAQDEDRTRDGGGGFVERVFDVIGLIEVLAVAEGSEAHERREDDPGAFVLDVSAPARGIEGRGHPEAIGPFPNGGVARFAVGWKIGRHSHLRSV
jgi:hypothetical protein